MTDCPKFVEMQKMFHGKFMAVVEVQPNTKTNNHCRCECGECKCYHKK
jgi:hypothetical protein